MRQRNSLVSEALDANPEDTATVVVVPDRLRAHGVVIAIEVKVPSDAASLEILRDAMRVVAQMAPEAYLSIGRNEHDDVVIRAETHAEN